ncbi:hypothetical protein IMG5_103580 [Ichthyophthirius multifiliis]|uniref:Uncharacterized protein n=1 Tax=Ichthyophthirius multifiliis TaxID=5932 RepID=G0QSU7_ICHMU|nr:hypothetical protein IMG5_103580 [Ichthyophthirius multifiliis]EGR31714.1 hypothetical protein IMG5_103580 [Ichthyophthirius multifiliis]|eukprot:XP_004035200.1 hypothetical protein IMG5_103580 [Ichthyophthirius multifiliis]
MDQYYNFKEKFLGKEGAFGEFKVLIGFFSESFWGFDKNALQELKRRGFRYDLVKKDEEFITKLNDYDIAWIIDVNPIDQKNQEKLILEFIFMV